MTTDKLISGKPLQLDKVPVSPLAKRGSTIALLGIVVNLVSNMLMVTVDSPGGIVLLVVSRLGLIALIVFALRYAIRALPQTAAGSGYSGRGRVIATFILCGIFIFGLISTTVSLFLLF